MNGYVLGVDGGGTKTHCALFDLNGNKVDLITGDATNHECLKGGFIELKNRLIMLKQQIEKRNNIKNHELKKCVFGLAGVDTKYQHAKISQIIREIGIDEFVLCNDAYLGVRAGCAVGYGISVINGTGFTTVGIDHLGKMVQIGGQGELTGDNGGGGFLGKEAICAVYDYLYKTGRQTIMKDILFRMFDIKRKEDFMEIITQSLLDGSLFLKDLCKVVFEAANTGDKKAIDILKEMGREMARATNGAIKQLDFSNKSRIDIILAGSVNVKGENSIAIDEYKRIVVSINKKKNFCFKILEEKPVVGAVIWAFVELGYKNEYIYNKVVTDL